ncbi:MAG: hypothetical protein WBG90_21305 [Saonia sp.]
MKRYINKIIVLGVTLGILHSCETDDKIVDGILDGFGVGAIIRTIDETNNLVFNDDTDSFDPGSNYVLVVEEQDEEDGALLQSVEVFVAFDDNSTELNDISTEEVLLQTLSAADFSTGPRGIPEATLTYTSDELVTATGIDESLVIGDDRFEFRLVLTLTNGEVFSNDDVGGPVSGGSFFAAPFEYFPDVLCSITEDLSGTHTYVTTNIIPAPGSGAVCTLDTVIGEVTWSPGVDEDGDPVRGGFASTDFSFGQYENCYVGRGAATGELINIVWDCTDLNPDGEVFLNEDGEVIPTDDDEEEAFSFSYTITNVTGPVMTLDFASSAGDRGTVELTREGGVDWPDIFTANND